MSDEISDLTGGVIRGFGSANVRGKITIGRVVKGDLIVINDDSTPDDGDKAPSKASKSAGKGPNIVIGDVAGGGIYHVDVDIHISDADFLRDLLGQ